MSSNNRSTVKILQFIIAIVAWFALGLQQYLIIDKVPGNGLTTLQAIGRFFIFFTVLTNLLVAIAMTSLLISPHSKWGIFFSRPSVQAATAAYIFIVGLTYNVILRSLWAPTGLDRLADELLHVAVPLLFLLYWFLFAPKHSLTWRALPSWLIYPAVYLVYALIRGATEGFYAYPFINVDTYGYLIVFRNAAGLMAIFIIVSLLFIFLAKRMQKN
jgi:hypothetical protein